MIRTLVVFSLVVITLPLLFAQQTSTPLPNPCATAQQKQFDFWVGEWDLTWPGEKAGETGHGTNSIKRIMDGCVVQDNFSGGNSMRLRGTSVSTFEPQLRTLQADLGRQRRQREAVRDGKKILQRRCGRTSARMKWTGVGKHRATAARHRR